MWLGELCSTNPLRIPHPKIDKQACQAQGVGILAKGEITLHDAYCDIFNFMMQQRASCEKSGEGDFSRLGSNFLLIIA